jgi:hypothetical protein
MRRSALVVLASLGLATPCFAGKLENALEARWRGAWVVTRVAVQSDCAGIHTDNIINGTLVSSKGRQAFRAGELAHVDKVDLKHSRVDLIVSLPEPLLLGYQDGPFMLFNETRCLVELDVELPRSAVKGDDVSGIDATLRQILDRFATREEAQASRSWNRRQRAPYPADYDQTLARHAAWKAQQVNAGIQARLDRALAETSRLTDRMSSDPDYIAGFAAGVEAMRAVNLEQCGDLMGKDYGNLGATPQVTRTYAASDGAQRWGRGYQDGLRLVFGLESLKGLPQCFVQVPETQEASQRRPIN